MNYKRLMHRIWYHGSKLPGQTIRFCMSGREEYKYHGQVITHYDFEWDKLGERAKLFLFTSPYYGAAHHSEMRQVVTFNYMWDARRQEFRRTHG